VCWRRQDRCELAAACHNRSETSTNRTARGRPPASCLTSDVSRSTSPGWWRSHLAVITMCRWQHTSGFSACRHRIERRRARGITFSSASRYAADGTLGPLGADPPPAECGRHTRQGRGRFAVIATRRWRRPWAATCPPVACRQQWLLVGGRVARTARGKSYLERCCSLRLTICPSSYERLSPIHF
jgi:hypothetical protein